MSKDKKSKATAPGATGGAETPRAEMDHDRLRRFIDSIPQEYLRPEDPEAPRARILDAATRLFAEKGFEGASTREMAEVAGVNQAMIHYYFGNKQNLYKRVIISQMYSLFLMIAEMIVENRSPVNFVAEFPLQLIEGLRTKPHFRSIMLREIAMGGTTIREMVEELDQKGPRGFRGMMHGLLQQGIDEGMIRDLPKDAMMITLLSLGYSGVFVETFYSAVTGVDLSKDAVWKEHRDAIKQLLLHGIAKETL